MLPRIDTLAHIPETFKNFIVDLNKQQFTGDINTSYGARLSVATDNSIYQQLPAFVVHPRSKKDIIILATLSAQTKYQSIKFSARGGGTGTNGQSLTPGIVVDLSKYMNQILEINIDEKWVKVEAGVIKDQLNDYLRPYGFFFAPDLSTSNRATIGGMISTDASGQGSLVYGKTSNHVLSLESVLANGELLSTAPMSITEAEEIAKQEPKLLLLVATPKQITRMEETFDWFNMLTSGERTLVWLRAYRYSWRNIQRKTGFPKTSAQRYWKKALMQVAFNLSELGSRDAV